MHGINHPIITLYSSAAFGEIYLSVLEKGNEGNLYELWNNGHVAGKVAMWAGMSY